MFKVRILLSLFLLLIVTLTTPSPAQAQAESEIIRNDNPIASLVLEPTGVMWPPHVEYSSLVLTVSTPSGEVLRKEFQRGANPSFNLVDSNGNKRPDGQYIYELRLIPVVSQQVRDALKASREDGNSKAVARELQQGGQLPIREVVQTGSFVVSQGAIISNVATETPNPVNRSSRNGTGQQPTIEDGPLLNDQVIPDDLIVQSSLCVGFDCVDGENFGTDTLRLKENNTRIKFDDTSSSAGFAANDWQLTANDQPSGGANKFSIDDITGAKTPFTITAGAPTNSIFLDSTGRLGLRTATPGLDVHVDTGNTPAFRLEQNAGGGFTAQTWDIGGNEANFFIRDLTGGSRLPFRIRPGAPTSSLDIAASGNVGIGTGSPGAKLDISSSRADANASGLRITDADNVNNNLPNPVAYLYNSTGFGQLDLFGATATQDVQIKAGGTSFFKGGNVGIGTSTPAFTLDVAGSLNATSYFINGVPFNTATLASGTGTTDKIAKWTNGPARTLGDSVIAESAAGNVGIGTTTPHPKSLLHVNKSWNDGTTLFVSNNNTGNAALVSLRAGLNPINYSVDYASLNVLSSNWPLGSAGPFLKGKTVLIEGNGSNLGIGNLNNTEPIIFYTTSGRFERMRINSNGNVGIGTTAPNAKLQVAGGDAYVETQGSGVILKATDGPNCFRLTVNNAGTLSTTAVTCP